MRHTQENAANVQSVRGGGVPYTRNDGYGKHTDPAKNTSLLSLYDFFCCL